MTNLLAFGDKVIGGSGGGSSDVASKIKLKRDEWVNIPTYDDYTNYYYDSLGHLSIHTYNDITIESGTVPIDDTVVYNVGTGWSGLMFTISDTSIISQMIGKTIEFGATGYDATFVPYAAYATLRYKDGDGDHYIHLNTTGEGSESLPFNTSGVAIQLLVPDDCEYIMMYYVSNTHASITTTGTLTLTNAYAFDINEIQIPDINNTKVEFNRYDNRPLTFSRNTINLIKSDKKIVSTDNNGNQVEFGGSDGVLPHLVVISESGSTVTASKDSVIIELEETSTDHFECDLNMPNPQDVYGIWLIDALLNGQDAQVSLNVDTIKKYIVDDEHFHASITVTYPTGATVSCGKTGETPMYATESPYTFVVHSTGTYIITGERDGSTEVQTVHITANGQEKFVTLTVVPDGSTATPIDSVPVWLKCAGIEDKDYTEVSEVLADDDTLLAVLTNSNATDYLVRSTTFITDIVADETAMAYIGAYDYASNTLIEDSTWNTAIANSTYKESVLNVKVPTMTSNTTPSGTCIGSSKFDSSDTYNFYKAFNGNAAQKWNSAGSGSTQYVGYVFPNAVAIYGIYTKFSDGSTSTTTITAKVRASNDGSSYTDVSDVFGGSASNEVYAVVNTQSQKYTHYIMQQASGSTGMASSVVQFYGRENGGVQTWLHSAGIYDKHYTTLAEVLLDTSTLAALMASNDAVDYLVTAKAFIDDIIADEHAMKFIGANDYASNTLLDDIDWAKGIVKSNYYTYLLYNVIPKMTSNTTPSGTCTSSSGSYVDNVPWRAFDRDDTTKWVSNTSPEYVQYQFPTGVKYTIYAVSQVDYNTNGGQTWNLQGSNDGTNFTTLATYSSVSHGVTQINATTVHSEFNIFRLQTPNNYGVMGVSELALMSHMNGGVQSWLHSAGIYNKLYTTVSEVASDIATMNALMSNHIAIAYLRSAKGLIEDITTNETAMKYIGAYDYASSELLSDADWCEGIYKSGYKNYVLNVSTPTMTSDETPSGEVIYNGYHTSTNQYGWYAFDKNNATQWSSSTNLFNGTEYIGYKFEFEFKAYRATYTQRTYSGDAANITVIYQGSNDNITWNDISQTESVVMIAASSPKTYVANLSAIHEYKYYRVLYLSSDGTKSIYPTVAELNFYGRHTGAVQDWLHSANITDKTYATITELANDKTTVMALMRNENALSYLVTAYGLVDEICSNQTIMGAIGSFDHVTDVLLANEVWLVGISNSEFRELVYNVKVPVMTSDTTPKGIASASSIYDASHKAYMAFDGNSTSTWADSGGSSPHRLSYQFERAVKIFAYTYNTYANNRTDTYKIQSSDDSTNWTDNTSTRTAIRDGQNHTEVLDTSTTNKVYSFYTLSQTKTITTLSILQFYGRETGAIQSWLNAAEIYDKNYTTLSELASDGTTLSALISNHDASDYLVTAKGLIDGVCSNPTIMSYIGLNNYCTNILLANATWLTAIANSTYVDPVLNVKVPTMTSATTPSGEVFASSYGSSYYPWYAFGNKSAEAQCWATTGNQTGVGYIGYDFGRPVKIVAVMWRNRNSTQANRPLKVGTIQGSNDGTTWVDIADVTTQSLTYNAVTNGAFGNNSTYSRYRLLAKTPSDTAGLNMQAVQFYGREDV